MCFCHFFIFSQICIIFETFLPIFLSKKSQFFKKNWNAKIQNDINLRKNEKIAKTHQI